MPRASQAIVFAALALLQTYVLPTAVPHMLDRQLPSIQTIVLHIVCCLPFAEIVFYSSHRLLHTPWFFQHIHYIHHSMTAPSAPTCIYAHPVEMILSNIGVVATGPMFMQCHLSVWMIWTLASIIDTMFAHSGWHLPFTLGSEGHDYHHSSGTGDNLGVIGTLDQYFGTNKHWHASWQRVIDNRYGGTGNYIVDKILVQATAEERAAGLKAAACDA